MRLTAVFLANIRILISSNSSWSRTRSSLLAKHNSHSFRAVMLSFALIRLSQRMPVRNTLRLA